MRQDNAAWAAFSYKPNSVHSTYHQRILLFNEGCWLCSAPPVKPHQKSDLISTFSQEDQHRHLTWTQVSALSGSCRGGWVQGISSLRSKVVALGSKSPAQPSVRPHEELLIRQEEIRFHSCRGLRQSSLVVMIPMRSGALGVYGFSPWDARAYFSRQASGLGLTSSAPSWSPCPCK